MIRRLLAAALPVLLLTACADELPVAPADAGSPLFDEADEPPVAASSLELTYTPGHVDLQWVDSSSFERTTRVLRQHRDVASSTWEAWESLAVLPADSTAYSDTTAVQGETYRYRVRPCNAAGCAPGTTKRIFADVPPAPPTDLAGIGAPSFNFFTWIDASDNETQFRVQRRHWDVDHFVAWYNHGTTGEDSPLFADFGVTENQRYRYRVRACNPAGCSPWVVLPGVVVAQFVPAKPAPVTLENPFPQAILINFTPVANATLYRMAYRMRPTTGGDWSAWTWMPTMTADVPPFNVLFGTAGNEYRFFVRACNDAGCSDWERSDIIGI